MITNDTYNSLISIFSLLATVLGVIIAIAIAFFAIKQLRTDKEINEYKDELKLFAKESVARRKEMREIADGLWQEKEKIKTEAASLIDSIKKEAKGVVSETEKGKLEKSLKKFEALEKRINAVEKMAEFQQGRIYSDTYGLSTLGWAGSVDIVPPGMLSLGCALCNSIHTPGSCPLLASRHASMQCPKCGQSFLEHAQVDGSDELACPK